MCPGASVGTVRVASAIRAGRGACQEAQMGSPVTGPLRPVPGEIPPHGGPPEGGPHDFLIVVMSRHGKRQSSSPRSGKVANAAIPGVPSEAAPQTVEKPLAGYGSASLVPVLVLPRSAGRTSPNAGAKTCLIRDDLSVRRCLARRPLRPPSMRRGAASLAQCRCAALLTCWLCPAPPGGRLERPHSRLEKLESFARIPAVQAV
jgi:hypothetical protein